MRAVLTYHSIDDSGSAISVSHEAFRAHCAFFARHVRVLPLTSLMADAAADDAVAITFDDAFANFGTLAAPMLRAHNLPATVFVVSGHVGGYNNWGGRPSHGIPHVPLLGWSQLGQLKGLGFDIGAHTVTHPRLSERAGAQLAEELDGCVAALERELGSAPSTFAYPYGALNAEAVEAVRKRFAVACTTELRPVAAGEDAALVPRLDMFYFRAPGSLDGWGSRSFQRRLAVRSAGRRVKGMVQRLVGVAQ